MSVSAFTVLGIDVGGTKIAAGVVEFPLGQVVAEQTLPTQPERGSEAVLSDVVRVAESLAGKRSVQHIGIGLCELVDPSGKILSQSCISWDPAEVCRRLAHLGPVTLEADVRAAARAEAVFGAGRSYRIFLYVTIGTGISCCLMLDGAPYLGARGATGTMASSPLAVACETCGHVNRRTLEQIASGPALVARYTQLRPNAAATAHDVITAATRGDRDAAMIVQSAADALGSVLGLLINALDPEAVIVGGGLGSTEGLYWETLLASTRRHIWSDVNRDLPIVHALTGPRAGIIGAALAAWKNSETRKRD